MAIRLSRRASANAVLSDVKYTPIRSTDDDSPQEAVQYNAPIAGKYPKLLKVSTAVIVVVLVCVFAYHAVPNEEPLLRYSSPGTTASLPDSKSHVPCFGARGKLLTESPDDELQEVIIDHGDALEIDLGSYRELPLQRTWSTSDGRYGPYGKGEKEPRSVYNRTVVPWHRIDWADLQTNCTDRNRHRFNGHVENISSTRRMAYPTEENSQRVPHRPSTTTGRTAIVLRGWEEFNFDDLDYWSLRALVTETTLAYGGDYAVFLLVDIHDTRREIFKSSQNYEAALDALVPPEFRNMTVLFDASLLEAWYPKVPDHGMFYQVWQPMQLFAHFFNDFDHYWQMEMDARFTGHSGRILEGLSTFARNEPRKQARERASYTYLENMYRTYSSFISAVNATLDGTSRFWSGISIPDLDFIKEPPVARAEEDDFLWGVGEDADCLLLGPCHNLTKNSRTQLRTFVPGFELGRKTQRVICAPASGRASWNLLNGIHTAQFEKGLAVPSEGTPASFALWLNLKISRPPFPMFLRDKHNHNKLDLLINGGRPKRENHGVARGLGGGSDPTNRRKHGIEFDNIEPTWRPRAKQAQRVFDAWFSGSTKKPLVRPLIVRNRKIWMTNAIVHPVKTNENGPKGHEGEN